jgi:hypothetical protein
MENTQSCPFHVHNKSHDNPAVLHRRVGAPRSMLGSFKLKGHSDYVRGVAVSADGRRALLASWDKPLKV